MENHIAYSLHAQLGEKSKKMILLRFFIIRFDCPNDGNDVETQPVTARNQHQTQCIRQINQTDYLFSLQ